MARSCSHNPAIHLYSISSIWPKTVFFPPIQVEKSGTSIHLKFQSALAVPESDLLSPSTADLRSPYSFPYSADFRFSTLVAGCRSSQSIDVSTSLAKGLAKKSAEFGLVGSPTFQSRYAIFHRFSDLTNVLFLLVSQNFHFGRDMNDPLQTWLCAAVDLARYARPRRFKTTTTTSIIITTGKETEGKC
ncbi:hypothetical protein AVEN_125873-1 [Araneus ventricosus]|uniref:Uncharacterized protein n=1 Tax=Araneus ventricosus TaxID=182803 RepID=A0A4Y2F6T0_ARAVE|nr:hypothetical protein AVEN_125873-1 [Araneus ventricosus]